MNILITPVGRFDTKAVFAYCRMLTKFNQAIREKHPEAPHMAVSMDDFACMHQYQFTGNVTPGEQHAIARCSKCRSQIVVKPRVINAESIEEASAA